MEKIFDQICEALFSKLQEGEYLTVNFSGEKSQFIRVNSAKVRQTGLIDDADLSMELMHDNRVCHGSITVHEPFEVMKDEAVLELERMRVEVIQLPEDPFIVLPENAGSTKEIKSANGLPQVNAVDALLPAMDGVDLVGIWASGQIFRGNANSAGQRHWFETETFSLDYSIVTPDHKMVKGTYAGTDWDQAAYEANIADSRKKLEVMNRAKKKLDPGEYRTWFAPAAVSDFIDMFSWNGISEASVQQGNSALGKMRSEGQKLSPLFHLAEDFRSGLVPRFNGRGEVAPDFLPLVDFGELANTLVSSRTAKEYKKKSNFASEGEYMRSPVMNSGSLDEKDVLKKLGTGLYLSNLHYLNWSDNTGGRITGLTRYACFWVENGEIQAPIETMRFDDTIYRFFGTELEAVGKAKVYLPNVLTYVGRELGGFSCPGILVKSFVLTL